MATAISAKETKLDLRSSSPRPPKRSEKPSTSRRLPITEPRQRAADDLELHRVDREEGDDQLRRVAEGGVEEAADARSRVLRRVLGRLPDQPRQRDQRSRREDELDRPVEVGEIVEQHDDRRERERVRRGCDGPRPRTLPSGALPEIRLNVKSCGAMRDHTQFRRGTACAGAHRAPSPASGRGGVPPVRGALRQGRLPRSVHRALVPVCLRVRGVGAHVRRLHADASTASRSISTCCAPRRPARRASAGSARPVRRSRCARSRSPPCYESRTDELGCRNPEFHEIPRARPSFRVIAQITPR